MSKKKKTKNERIIALWQLNTPLQLIAFACDTTKGNVDKVIKTHLREINGES